MHPLLTPSDSFGNDGDGGDGCCRFVVHTPSSMPTKVMKVKWVDLDHTLVDKSAPKFPSIRPSQIVPLHNHAIYHPSVHQNPAT